MCFVVGGMELSDADSWVDARLLHPVSSWGQDFPLSPPCWLPTWQAEATPSALSRLPFVPLLMNHLSVAP
jgi:hypothetical protein